MGEVIHGLYHCRSDIQHSHVLDSHGHVEREGSHANHDGHSKGDVADHLGRIQDVANRKLPVLLRLRRASHRLLQLLRTAMEYLLDIRRRTSMKSCTLHRLGPLFHASMTALQYFPSSSLICPACGLLSKRTFVASQPLATASSA